MGNFAQFKKPNSRFNKMNRRFNKMDRVQVAALQRECKIIADPGQSALHLECRREGEIFCVGVPFKVPMNLKI